VAYVTHIQFAAFNTDFCTVAPNLEAGFEFWYAKAVKELTEEN